MGRELIDIAGKVFNDWTVLRRDGNYITGEAQWRCRCKCGYEGTLTGGALRGGAAHSCTECGRKRAAAKRSLDIAGQRFGHLVALEFADKMYRGCRVWKCKCDCGAETEAAASHLVQGVKISCGCAMHVHDSPVKRSQKIRRRMLALQNRRRARQLNADGSHTEEQVSEIYFRQKGKCANCFCKIKMDALHRDHKIPLSKGGSNHIQNIQLLCASCNSRKSAKDPLVFAREQGRLV